MTKKIAERERERERESNPLKNNYIQGVFAEPLLFAWLGRGTFFNG